MPNKVRVFELAKDLNMPSKDLVNLLNELGVRAKNHMSAIDENAARYVMRKYGPEARKVEVKPETPVQAKEAPKPEEAREKPAPPAEPAQPARPVHEPDKPQASSPSPPVPERPIEQPKPHYPFYPAGQRPPGPRPQPQAQQQPAVVRRPPYPREPFRGAPRPDQGPRPPLQGQQTARPMDPRRPITPAPRPDFRPGPVAPSRTGPQPRPATGGYAPRPASQGPVRRGPGLVIPPPPPPPAQQQAGRPKQWGSKSRRKGEDFGFADRHEEERKADKRGRKRGPTALPLDDPRLRGRRLAIEDVDDDGVVRRAGRRREKASKVRRVEIPTSISVRDLAAKLEVSPSDAIRKLMQLGTMVSINQEIDGETAQVLATEFGFEAELTSEREQRETTLTDMVDPPESLKPRPPVVTIMGHVDHGKTSLLDAIREANVTATEAGGITQHIGAYQVSLKGRKITFLDTPGHEAFTKMRARGAQATDVVVLVVAADDGVMPQTVEALNHARAAKVPIVVAINKIDKPNAQPDRVARELADHGLILEKWGGDTVSVEVSALKHQGISELLEMILLVADMRELKANPDRLAYGVVVEAKIDKGRGPVATVLIQKGTLKVGDAFLVGEVTGRVRAMADDKGAMVEEASPSMPVEVLGLEKAPEAGDVFQAVADDREARQIAEKRAERRRLAEMKQGKRVSLEDLFNQIKQGEVKELQIIIKADVQGSVEAVKMSLERLSTDEVKVNVIHGGVGAITESDIMLASASEAIVIGFNVRPEPQAARKAEDEDVDVRLYRVIYDAIDDVRKAMEGLLEPEYREVSFGRAEVRQVFRIPKVGLIAGCQVTDGKIPRSANVRVVRNGVVVHEGRLASLKRFKDDVKEVAQGFECGIGIEGFNDIKELDIIEAYGKEELKRVL